MSKLESNHKNFQGVLFTKISTVCKESFIPTGLIQDLRAGNVLAWVGAGLSIGMGYPSWEVLVCKIAENIDRTQWGNSNLQDWVVKTASNAPEWVAEVLSQTDRKAYCDALQNEFGCNTKETSVTHALLTLLPFRGYITTNYDALIEHSIETFTNYKPHVYTPANAKTLLIKDQDQKFVYKVHGSISESVKDVVLTETEYYALLHDGVYSKILSSMLSKYTLVGFGYSLRDRDFRSILNERYELFRNNCPPFYMFTSSKDTCTEEIECYRKNFNVHIVSVSPECGFEELSSTIFSMYCLCHRIESEINLHDISELLETRLNAQSILIKIAGKPDLEKANQFLSSYYKSIIDKYYHTLSYLLKHSESFDVLITSKNELKRIVEYYKQQGLWNEWLDIASSAQKFCGRKLKTDILQSIAWIYFWTRDYDRLHDLLEKYPQVNRSNGVNNYSTKLSYMTSTGLVTQGKKLRDEYDKGKRDYFDISLLGRIYARLSIIEAAKKDFYLSEAKKFIEEALRLASTKADMIETAVQNWYLALVLIDKGEVEVEKFIWQRQNA